MTQASDFKAGDYVNHFNMKLGRVIEITKGGAVKVTFDHGKDDWYGEYDALWFRLHPYGLTKVSEPRSRWHLHWIE